VNACTEGALLVQLRADGGALVDLSPGGGKPVTRPNAIGKEYENSPEHIIAGQQLYKANELRRLPFQWPRRDGSSAYGQVKNGWLYRGAIDNIASSILEGRPNGIPSFRGTIVNGQVWELAAYIKSLLKSTEER
jgi:cytochrome c oxidase cbb3-type subunit 3